MTQEEWIDRTDALIGITAKQLLYKNYEIDEDQFKTELRALAIDYASLSNEGSVNDMSYVLMKEDELLTNIVYKAQQWIRSMVKEAKEKGLL